MWTHIGASIPFKIFLGILIAYANSIWLSIAYYLSALFTFTGFIDLYNDSRKLPINKYKGVMNG